MVKKVFLMKIIYEWPYICFQMNWGIFWDDREMFGSFYFPFENLAWVLKRPQINFSWKSIVQIFKNRNNNSQNQFEKCHLEVKHFLTFYHGKKAIFETLVETIRYKNNIWVDFLFPSIRGSCRFVLSLNIF